MPRNRVLVWRKHILRCGAKRSMRFCREARYRARATSDEKRDGRAQAIEQGTEHLTWTKIGEKGVNLLCALYEQLGIRCDHSNSFARVSATMISCCRARISIAFILHCRARQF